MKILTEILKSERRLLITLAIILIALIPTIIYFAPIIDGVAP